MKVVTFSASEEYVPFGCVDVSGTIDDIKSGSSIIFVDFKV